MIRIKIPHIRHKRLKGCLAACVLLHSLASAVCLLQWGQRTRDLSLRGHCRFHPGEMKHYNGMRSISATATIALLVGSCLWSIRPFRFVIAWIQLAARVQSTSTCPDASARNHTGYTSTIQDIFSTIAIFIITFHQGCRVPKSSAFTNILSPLRSSTRRRAVMESSTCDL
jgi:hypothetical protein